MRKIPPLEFGWYLVFLGTGIGLFAVLLLISPPFFNLPGREKMNLDRKKSDPPNPELKFETRHTYYRIDSLLRTRGFARLDDYDTLLCIDLRYATSNTFAGKPFYSELKGCWLHPLAAHKLIAAARMLRESHADSLRLLVYDATRPLSAQYNLYWAACSVGAGRYVAVPWGGSLHNYGLAVDVGLADAKCRELNLGTPFDSFDSLAQPRYETHFLHIGRLDSAAWQRRHILRQVMRASGFRRIDLEWWHFEALTIDSARARYQLVP
jgi:D-alanyl-D-alanine dipeptidase